MSKIYNVFISHAWDYNHHYDKIVDFLNSDNDFTWKDYSVPMNDPIHTNGTDKQLKEAIQNKIKYTSVVVLIAGVYVSYRKWIDIEIEIALQMKKPIITVELWGAERSSDKAQQSATEIVKWQASSIINAIKKHG